MNNPSESMNELYPYNLLYVIFGGDNELIPQDLPDDFCGSMEYVLAMLEPAERTVLKFRYACGMTIQEIAAQYTADGENIRRIESKALRKLRHPARVKYLRYGVQGIIQEECERACERERKRARAWIAAYYEEPQDGKDSQAPKENVLQYTIEELDLSVRAFNCLCRAGYRTVADIMAADRDKLLGTLNLGRRSYDEVFAKLESLGLDVGKLRLDGNAEA